MAGPISLLISICVVIYFLVKEHNKTKPVKLKIGKISTPLDEDRYWSLVENAYKETSYQEEQIKILVNTLEQLGVEDIIGFKLKTSLLMQESYNEKLWCAAFINNQGCSDDAFEYFRAWVISIGKDVFYRALKNPDSLILQLEDCVDDHIENEDFLFVADYAFQFKTNGGNIYDYLGDEPPMDNLGYPDIEFSWDENKPENMKLICPKLFKKFWN